jgi:outer membrane protein assembly factor BamD
MINRPVLIATTLTLSLLCCSGAGQKAQLQPEDSIARAEQLAGEGDCREAVLYYEEILSEFPPPNIAERARFGRARCRYELEDYDLAIDELENFIDAYPKSDLVDDAMYLVALCYLDQAPRAERDQRNTVKAIDELEFLLKEYPASNVSREAGESLAEARAKLAHKEYLSGKLYLGLEYFRAARIYFDLVLDEYSDTKWAPWAMLGKGETYDREGKTTQALDLYRRVVSSYPGTLPAGRAGVRISQITGGARDESGE